MRDAFGDGLERMARLEELAQRRAAAQQNAGPMAHAPRPSAADEVTEAVRRVVETYPGTTVSVTVDGPAGATSVQVGWFNGVVVVLPGPAPDAAARLAELIRRDPSLLAAEPEH